MNYLTIRIICSFIIGILLIIWPLSAIIYLISSIGVVLALCGFGSLLSYWLVLKNKNINFPILGFFVAIVGIWLILFPSLFAHLLMYILGIGIIIAALIEIISLRKANFWHDVSFVLYLFPILMVVLGIIVLFNPFLVATIPIIILGFTCLLYSIYEIYLKIRLSKLNDKYEN